MMKICPVCGANVKEDFVRCEFEHHILPWYRCKKCNVQFPYDIVHPKNIDKDYSHDDPYSWHKIKQESIDKIADTYLSLATAIQGSGGNLFLIYEYKYKPLSEFLEKICAPNGIRFKHKKEKK